MTINGTVSALRFFFTVTLRLRDLAQLQRAVRWAAGGSRRVGPHSLRHSFATYQLEQDVDIRVIQVLLAHAKLDTTAIYTKVPPRMIQAVASPLDRIIALMEGKTPPG